MGADLTLLKNRDYYRDSYNNSNLLWQFGLDYWTWFASMLDDDGNLSKNEASNVLIELKKREQIFADNLSKLNDEEKEYFRDKYKEFSRFLTKCIATDDKVSCSI